MFGHSRIISCALRENQKEGSIFLEGGILTIHSDHYTVRASTENKAGEDPLFEPSHILRVAVQSPFKIESGSLAAKQNALESEMLLTDGSCGKYYISAEDVKMFFRLAAEAEMLSLKLQDSLFAQLSPERYVAVFEDVFYAIELFRKTSRLLFYYADLGAKIDFADEQTHIWG